MVGGAAFYVTFRRLAGGASTGEHLLPSEPLLGGIHRFSLMLRRTFSSFLVAVNLVCVMRENYCRTRTLKTGIHFDNFEVYLIIPVPTKKICPCKDNNQYISIEMRIYLQNVRCSAKCSQYRNLFVQFWKKKNFSKIGNMSLEVCPEEFFNGKSSLFIGTP